LGDDDLLGMCPRAGATTPAIPPRLRSAASPVAAPQGRGACGGRYMQCRRQTMDLSNPPTAARDLPPAAWPEVPPSAVSRRREEVPSFPLFVVEMSRRSMLWLLQKRCAVPPHPLHLRLRRTATAEAWPALKLSCRNVPRSERAVDDSSVVDRMAVSPISGEQNKILKIITIIK